MNEHREWPLMTKKAKKHRAKHGWAPSDTWNLDSYISRVLAESLTYFADSLHGHPLSPALGAQVFDVEPEGENQQAWRAIVLEMAEGFRGWADRFDESDLGSEEEAYRRVRRSIRLMHRWFGDLWD